MTGTQFTVEDFETLFDGAPKNSGVSVRTDEGDRFGSSSTTVTVTITSEARRSTPIYTSDYVSGTTRNATQDDSDPYGPREATR
jgi:hypothetical protein